MSVVSVSNTKFFENPCIVVNYSLLPQRTTPYRYGFNGKEKDDEIKGSGDSYDFGERMYDPRLGKWLSVDKLASKYPYASPYNFALNNPIFNVDPDGGSVAPGDQQAKDNFDTRLKTVFAGSLAEVYDKINYTTVGTVKVNGKDVEVQAFTFTGDVQTAINKINKSSLTTKDKLVALSYLSTVSTENVLNLQTPLDSKDNKKVQSLKIYSEKYKYESQDYRNDPEKNASFATGYYANDPEENGQVPTTSKGKEVTGTRNTNGSSADLDDAAREFSGKLGTMANKVKVETKEGTKTKVLDSNGEVQDKPERKKK
jgi:RHS repeat-associated protein